LPQTDVAINKVNEGAPRLSQVNFFDNATSLPMGEGLQLAFMRSDPNGGYYPRKG